MKRIVLALAMLIAGPLAAQQDPLPQGVRVRVWSQTAGVRTGIMSGQLETAIVLSDEPAGRCRELVSERIQSGLVGRTPFFGREREYIPSVCPVDTIIIPGNDISRIDISEGMRGTTYTVAGIGMLAGFVAGPWIVYADDGSTGDVIVYGSAIGLSLALAGGLVGAFIGSMFDVEHWRQIR